MERAAARVEWEIRQGDHDGATAGTRISPQLRQLLDELADPSPERRKQAWRNAGLAGAEAVAPLAREYLSSSVPAISQVCYMALARIVFHAGRPGAEEEAGAVADALLGLIPTLTAGSLPPIAEARPPVQGLFELFNTMARDALRGMDRRVRLRRIRSDAVYWAGLLSSERHVPALSALLREADVSREAREALLRIPGGESTRALMAAAENASRETDQVGIIQALSERNSPEAIAWLRRLARSIASEPARWACLDALARLGVSPADVFPPRPHFSAKQRARYTQAGLITAQTLLDRGQGEKAEQLFRFFTDLSAQRYQIRAALVGLAALRSEGLLPLALGYLTTPGVRQTALRILREDERPGVNERLTQVYTQTDPQMRATILDVLAQRRAEGLQKLLDEALVSELPELRLAASRVLGIPCDERDLVHLAIRGGPWIRGDALRTYLDLAHTRAISGDTETAATVFRNVLEGPFPVWSQREALEGLGHLGREDDWDVVKGYAHDPDLGRNAFAALVYLAPRLGNRDQAHAALANIAENAPYEEIAADAVRALADMGENITPYAHRYGYVTRWRILGPFPNRDGEAFGKPFFPEAMGDAYDFVEYGGTRFVWRDAVASSFPAVVDLQHAFGPYEAVAAYGFTRLAMPAWTPVEFHIESEDGYEFWLNGEKLHARRGLPPSNVGEDIIAAMLKPGFNRILVKVLQDTGPWQYRVRVTGRRGEPLDLSKQRVPDDGTAGVGMRAGTVVSATEEGLP